jgi:hypothetical protein
MRLQDRDRSRSKTFALSSPRSASCQPLDIALARFCLGAISIRGICAPYAALSKTSTPLKGKASTVRGVNRTVRCI